VVRELPLLVWWILGLGTAVRWRLPGAPEGLGERLLDVLRYAFGLGLLGGIARALQVAMDTRLSSNR
jgi:hypothetical protein